MHPNPGNPDAEQPGQGTPGHVVGRFAGAFSGSLRGLKLVPAKWRYLIPPALIRVLRDEYPVKIIRDVPPAVGLLSYM